MDGKMGGHTLSSTPTEEALGRQWERNVCSMWKGRFKGESTTPKGLTQSLRTLLCPQEESRHLLSLRPASLAPGLREQGSLASLPGVGSVIFPAPPPYLLQQVGFCTQTGTALLSAWGEVSGKEARREIWLSR